MRKKAIDPNQLSLFENNEPFPFKEPTVIDFVRARVEHGPEMDQEDYKRWVKILINNFIRSTE